MKKVTKLVLLFGLMMPTVWCIATGSNITDGYSHILIKESKVEGSPKGSTIQAVIDGHNLSVYFSQDIGVVTVDITTAAGATVTSFGVLTPDGLSFYIPSEGDYIAYFTLSNGDVYYGEFTVMD